ncbi:MAG: amidase [Proteobacteria bacterium]|nr:amidase [Pseudomonadota bacterium]
MHASIHYSTLNSVAELIKQREVSPVELTNHMLSRIEAVDKQLKSFATVMVEHALEAASRAERQISSGHYRGPLHGVPIAVKDLCYTAGVRTMGGLRVRRDFVPDHDATVVAKLEAAGAILLGKLNLTEGALSAYHPNFDIPVNPWGSELWSGVSSSGSGVATAAGLCFGCLGTDTGGSIRYPSMANGIVGLKPTYGRVSRYGVLALAESLDHVGPMTRSVKDAALILQAIAGHDPRDATSLHDPVPDIASALDANIAGLRIGVDESYIKEGTDSGLVTAIEGVIDILQQLGAELVEVSMPKSDPIELRKLWLPITGYEALQAHADTFPSRAEEYGGYLRSVLELGMGMSEADYNAVMEERWEYAELFKDKLARVDAVICPAGGFVFEADKQAQYGNAEAMQAIVKHFQGQFTIPADLAGTPSLTLPCGFSNDGRPYAVQLLGSRLAELALCRIGHAYEKATEWHSQHPDV